MTVILDMREKPGYSYPTTAIWLLSIQTDVEANENVANTQLFITFTAFRRIHNRLLIWILVPFLR